MAIRTYFQLTIISYIQCNTYIICVILHISYKYWSIPILACLPYIMPALTALQGSNAAYNSNCLFFFLATDQPLSKSNCFSKPSE